MKVHELITKLQSCRQDLNVFIWDMAYGDAVAVTHLDEEVVVNGLVITNNATFEKAEGAE